MKNFRRIIHFTRHFFRHETGVKRRKIQRMYRKITELRDSIVKYEWGDIKNF